MMLKVSGLGRDIAAGQKKSNRKGRQEAPGGVKIYQEVRQMLDRKAYVEQPWANSEQQFLKSRFQAEVRPVEVVRRVGVFHRCRDQAEVRQIAGVGPVEDISGMPIPGGLESTDELQ